jgi:hypothetical protein
MADRSAVGWLIFFLFGLHGGVKLFLLFSSDFSVFFEFSLFSKRHGFAIFKISIKFSLVSFFMMAFLHFQIDTVVFDLFKFFLDLFRSG